MTLEHVVLDASALIDLVRDAESGTAVRERLTGRSVHAPAHLDAEVLSGLGRLHRAGALSGEAVVAQLAAVSAAPIERHPIPALLEGTWSRRAQLRLADALYVELADRLGAPLITTDARLGRATTIAEVIAPMTKAFTLTRTAAGQVAHEAVATTFALAHLRVPARASERPRPATARRRRGSSGSPFMIARGSTKSPRTPPSA